MIPLCALPIRAQGRSSRRARHLAVEAMEGRTLLTAAAFQVTQDWGSGFGGQVAITNTQATPVNNWSLAFDFDRSITSIWDGKITSHVGNHYVVTNAGWNATIAANGGTAEFGFNGAPGNVGTDHPTNYTLNGVPIGGGVAGTPTLSVGDISVREGGRAGTAPITFTVSLSAASTGAVSVHYATADGTAQDREDYLATSGTLTFAPGTVRQTVTVSVINDTAPSAAETFDLKLSAPVGATIARGTGVGTIVDTLLPPVATADSARTTPGTPVNIDVLANDSDPDGDALSISALTQGAHGQVARNPNGTLTYTPAAGFVGTDSFTYTISDGHGGTASAGVTVAVAAPATASAWPAHVFAPYVDMTLYPTYNLVSTAQAQGLKYFTLAFIVADPSNAPSWGGYNSYEVNGGAFDQAIRSQVAALRQLGGDVMVSFGGANGQELAQTITSVPALTAAYEQVINAYNLTHIDFDIEGAAEADHASIDRRSHAIAAAQAAASAAGKPLDVDYTLPALPSGLTADGLYVLQSAQRYGVRISHVNIMTMDFGDSAAPSPQGLMGSYVIQSGQSLFGQLQGLYGTAKTNAQLWSMVGITPMIGVNDASDEVFGLSDAREVEAWASQKGIGRISMWSLNRDQADPRGALTYAESTSSSLVQQPYDFSGIFKPFTS